MSFSLILNYIKTKNLPGHHSALCLAFCPRSNKRSEPPANFPHALGCVREVGGQRGRRQYATLDRVGCGERDRRWLRRAWQMPFSPPNTGHPPEVKASIRGRRSSCLLYAWPGKWLDAYDDQGSQESAGRGWKHYWGSIRMMPQRTKYTLNM